MDSAIHTATAHLRGICRIDYDIDLLRGDVTLNDFYTRVHVRLS